MDSNGYIKSIMQVNDDAECFICGMTTDLCRHEVFQGCYRQQSKAYGLWVNLCPRCHRYIHSNPQSMEAKSLDVTAQTRAMHTYGWTTTQFIKIFGKNRIRDEKNA